MDEVDGLRAAARRDPRRVESAATQIVERARGTGDDVLLSRALAVRGRARRSLGDIEPAESDLRRSVEAARRTGDADIEADARIGLAGVLTFAGRSGEAAEQIDHVERSGSERLCVLARLQRALLGQRSGSYREALTAYSAALPVLRTLDATQDVALVLMNRGIVRVYLGDTVGAVADLSEATELFRTEGDDWGVAQARHNLGWTYARLGRLPQALELLDEAAESFRRLGHEPLEVEQDRVEALLAAGLCGDALATGAATARRLDALGNHSRAAAVWLLCGQAALLDGDRALAASLAERARALFAAHGATVWERIARLETIRAGAAAADVDELRSLAAAQDDAGDVRGAVTALALAAVAAAGSGDLPAADALAASCRSRARRLGLVEIDVLAAHAGATCAAAAGDLRAARRHVRRGLRQLDRHRSSLAATDARAAVSLHGFRLAELGLRLAHDTGSAPRFLREMERARTGRGRHQPAVPPQDAGAASELEELRAVVAAVRQLEAEGEDTFELLNRQSRLEHSIRARALKTAAVGAVQTPDAPPTVRELRAVLGEGFLLELVEVDSRLLGVVLHGQRPARLVDLGPASDIHGLARAVTTALGAVLKGVARSGSQPHTGLLERSLDALDAVVSEALSGSGRVVLVLPARLYAVPWSLLPCLRGRPVAVAPSARWWAGAEGGADDARTGPITVAAGPRLTEAQREAEGVAAHHGDALLLTGGSATASAVLHGLADASLAHIACHGRIRHDNPLWSCLELADGPLYVYDLERVRRTPPTVVLSGCDTGVGVRAGDELLGLSTALLDQGTRRLVATVCPLPDSAATRRTMVSLHGRLAAGEGPATALAQLAGSPDPELVLLAGSLVTFGTW